MKPIFEQENFLDPYICKKLIEYQENNSLNSKNYMNDMSLGFWESRVVGEGRYDDTIKNITNIIHNHIINLINNFYNDKVYLELTNLVYWGEGMELELHGDNFWIDDPKAQHPVSHRDYSSVLYLNDNFDGGETYFENSRYQIKPKTGKLVFFTSGPEHVHGVKKITRGKRYTLATWYTKNKIYAII